MIVLGYKEYLVNEHIIIILKENNIDPDKRVNGQTALEFLEAAILGALEEIEEE